MLKLVALLSSTVLAIPELQTSLVQLLRQISRIFAPLVSATFQLSSKTARSTRTSRPGTRRLPRPWIACSLVPRTSTSCSPAGMSTRRRVVRRLVRMQRPGSRRTVRTRQVEPTLRCLTSLSLLGARSTRPRLPPLSRNTCIVLHTLLLTGSCNCQFQALVQSRSLPKETFVCKKLKPLPLELSVYPAVSDLASKGLVGKGSSRQNRPCKANDCR